MAVSPQVSRSFTLGALQVEDRPIVKEIKTYVREHHPVEKEFVVETRPTGKYGFCHIADSLIFAATQLHNVQSLLADSLCHTFACVQDKNVSRHRAEPPRLLTPRSVLLRSPRLTLVVESLLVQLVPPLEQLAAPELTSTRY